MPKFLEAKLKQEYGANSKIPYKVMNSIGAMRGNKETEKGREMEKKHMAKMNYMRTEIEHHRDGDGKMTGHTVKHYPMPKATKSGAFMDRGEPSTHVFGPKDGAKMMSHLKEHLGIGAAPSPKDEEGEMHAAEHEPPAAETEEDSEGE